LAQPPHFFRASWPPRVLGNRLAAHFSTHSPYALCSRSSGSHLFAPFAHAPRSGKAAHILGLTTHENLAPRPRRVTPFAVAAPVAKLGDFELTDQEVNERTYRFPKTKVTVITVADQKGADQLAPWIERVYERFQNQIDIGGVADVAMIPKLFQPILWEAFKKQLGYSVMLDWDNSLVKQFALRKKRGEHLRD
jgi:hypothetical protein